MAQFVPLVGATVAPASESDGYRGRYGINFVTT
jgi:hypothetical protein